MWITQAAIAFVIALIGSIVLVTLIGRRGPGPWSGAVYFFVLLFLAVWAIGIWLRPVGPALWGVSWLGFFGVGLILAIFFSALTPPGRAEAANKETEQTEATIMAFGLFFWLVLLISFGVIITRYVTAAA